MFETNQQFVDLTQDRSNWLNAISKPNAEVMAEVAEEEGDFKLTHEMMQTLADEAKARLTKFRLQCFIDNQMRGL